MGFFVGYKNIRLRINKKGHIVEEVEIEDNWLVVWSSAPLLHQNATIGIPYLTNKMYDYKLIIEDMGNLNLYDSVGALIWCRNENCKHRNGYEFNKHLQSKNGYSYKDSHNYINTNLKSLDISTIKSLDIKCDVLYENEALTSSNKRFKLILESNGNLIIKNGIVLNHL